MNICDYTKSVFNKLAWWNSWKYSLYLDFKDSSLFMFYHQNDFESTNYDLSNTSVLVQVCMHTADKCCYCTVGNTLLFLIWV